MARRIKTLAKYINEHVPGLTAEVVRGYCNTDRKIAGTRLRHPGKGRWGNRLIVKDSSGAVVLDHNAAENWKSNDDIEHWLLNWEAEARVVTIDPREVVLEEKVLHGTCAACGAPIEEGAFENPCCDNMRLA